MLDMILNFALPIMQTNCFCSQVVYVDILASDRGARDWGSVERERRARRDRTGAS